MVTAMASVKMDSVLLRLREGDHVGVLKRTLKGGTELVRGIETITTAATIPAGHKIALKPVANGEPCASTDRLLGLRRAISRRASRFIPTIWFAGIMRKATSVLCGLSADRVLSAI